MRQILCVPFESQLGDVRRNRTRLLELAGNIAASGAAPDIIILPELALSGYLLESLVAQAAITYDELLALAGELTTTGVKPTTEWIVGFPFRDGKEVYNAAAVLSGGGIRHIHKKLFLPTYGMFDEGRYFTRGHGFSAYDGVLGKTAILICEDAWHMELAYAAAETLAETVIVISSSPARGYAKGEDAFDSTITWRSRLQIFAESYGQNYVYCNRSGVEDGILYDGSNFVLDAAARLVEGRPLAPVPKAGLYTLAGREERHAGVAGDSARQNDLLLTQKIFRDLTLNSG